MKRINLGVIGCGAIAESEHIPNILSIPQCRLNAICDIKKNRLSYIGKRFNIENRFTDYKEMLEDDKIDSVIIATNAPSHKEIVMESLKKGKSVFVEKPITTSIEDAKRILSASERTHMPVMVGYQLRFLPNHIKVKEYMKKKLVGKLLLSHIRAETLVIKPEETLLIDFATHFFDLIGWYLDKERIASISGSLREDDNDNQVASTTILNYESGTHSVIETVWVPRFNWGVVNRTFEAIGDAGKISTKLSGPEIQMWRANSTRDRIFGIKSFNPKETANSFMPLSSLCYREEMKTFVDCLIKKKTMPVNAGDGLRALKIAESTLVSYKKNRVVGFNEI